jgi:hypothetical protein
MNDEHQNLPVPYERFRNWRDDVKRVVRARRLLNKQKKWHKKRRAPRPPKPFDEAVSFPLRPGAHILADAILERLKVCDRAGRHPIRIEMSMTLARYVKQDPETETMRSGRRTDAFRIFGIPVKIKKTRSFRFKVVSARGFVRPSRLRIKARKSTARTQARIRASLVLEAVRVIRAEAGV